MSDGAYGLIAKKEIRDLSVKNSEITGFISDVLSLVESRIIKDDYSVVAAEIG